MPKSENIKGILRGGPTSGKGTQCKKIAEHYGFSHLNVGDILREQIELDRDFSEFTEEEGTCVPSDTIAEFLQAKIDESGSNKLVIDVFLSNYCSRTKICTSS